MKVTNLEQSKELAKILPFKSADLCFQQVFDEQHKTTDYRIEMIPYRFYSGISIPAWSLVALLDVLPQGTRLLKSATDNTYHCDCPKGNIDKWFDNPIDACYELVLKLHEENIL